MIARSNAKAKYRAMALKVCELIWIQSLASKMGVVSSQYLVMHCDNQVVMYITNNSVFHGRRKHIEVDCHFILDMVMAKQIVTSYVSTGAQLSDIFTKALFWKPFLIMCNKLGMIDIYAPV